IQLLSYAAMKARVEIQLEGEADLPAVFGVPDRLQQAVLNLVLNAIQAMPHGGRGSPPKPPADRPAGGARARTGPGRPAGAPGGRVCVQRTAANDLVRVTVTDTGPGLPQELAEGLFDTRVTTKSGGTGLGLPLVRMIAEAHGGSVWYRSDPGHGATFTLVLP